MGNSREEEGRAGKSREKQGIAGRRREEQGRAGRSREEQGGGGRPRPTCPAGPTCPPYRIGRIRLIRPIENSPKEEESFPEKGITSN